MLKNILKFLVILVQIVHSGKIILVTFLKALILFCLGTRLHEICNPILVKILGIFL